MLLNMLKRYAVKEGEFVLKQGGTSRIYVDIRKAAMRSDIINIMGSAMLDSVLNMCPDVTSVGGPADGAIPLVSAILSESGRRGNLLNGFYVTDSGDIKGNLTDKSVIVEDTSTTGRSILSAFELVKQSGCDIIGAVALVDRGAEHLLRRNEILYDYLYYLDGDVLKEKYACT